MTSTGTVRKEDYPINLLEAVFSVEFTTNQRKNYLGLYNDSLSDIRASLNYALGTLKESYEEVIRLYYKEGLSFAEIGRRLELSQSRIMQIHYRAKSELRRNIPMEYLTKGIKSYYIKRIYEEKAYSYEMGKSDTLAAYRNAETEITVEKSALLNIQNHYCNMAFEEFADKYNLSLNLRFCICRYHKGERRIKSVGDIIEMTEEEVKRIYKLKVKEIYVLKEALDREGLSFKANE